MTYTIAILMCLPVQAVPIAEPEVKGPTVTVVRESITINGKRVRMPADRKALARKLERAEAAWGRDGDERADEQFVLVLERPETGEVRGTCQLMTMVGQQWPFYSYRLTTLTQHSQELARTVRAEMLSLVTDLEGCSEVGGLFLHPNERAGGLGLLLARSRYLFIAMHRRRFSDRILAELRGIIDERGGSPFWDAIGDRKSVV